MKKIIPFVVSLFMIILFTGNVQAKTTVDANFSSVKEQVNVGEDVVVTLSFQNYTDVKTGFNAFKATLEYDEDVFEKVTEKNFISLNDWELLKYNPDTKEFVAIKKAGSKSAEDIVQISFSVKKDVKDEQASVRVVDLVTSEGEEDIYFTSKTEGSNAHEIKLNIVKSDESSSSNKNDNDNNTNNKDDNDKNNKPSVNNNSNNNHSNNNDLNNGNEENNNNENNNHNGQDNEEYTPAIVDSVNTVGGKKSNIFIIMVIIAMIVIPLAIAVIILCILVFRKKEKEQAEINDVNKKMRMFIFLFTVFGVSILGTGVIFAATSRLKCDINHDGKVDYTDVSLLEYHLIHTPGRELIGDDYLYADMNHDGELTVTDLSLVVQKVEKTLDYKVVVSDLKADNYYPNKKDEITIKFAVSARYNARVISAIIDNKEYEVERIGLTQEYQVKFPVGSIDGLKTYSITGVTLYNGQTYKIDEKITVDVKKDIPSIANYLIEEDKERGIAKLSFDVVDRDNSLKSGTVQVLNNGAEILNKKVKAGKNTFEFKAQGNIKYLIKINLNYDLATNQLEQKQDCTGNKLFSYDYQFAFDYNFKISDIKTYKNQEEATIFSKDEKIILGFHSSNNSTSIPSKVTINGKEYDIAVNGNRYEVNLGVEKNSGIKEFKITSVTLSNNIKIDVSKSVNVEILKDRVFFTDYSEEYDIGTFNVILKFNIEDKDDAFVSGKAILTNNTDHSKVEQNITAGQNSISFKVMEDVSYSLKIDVSYARDAEKQEIVHETVKTSDIKLVHDYEIEVTDLKTSNKDNQTLYFNKNENIKTGFSITNNTTFTPVKAIINGEEYDLTYTDGVYEAQITGFNTAGVKEIKLEGVILNNKKHITFDDNHLTKVEILKEKPSIHNFNYDETEDGKLQVTFDVIDNDNAITSGNIVIKDEYDREIVTREIKVGRNSITLTMNESDVYTATISAEFDLDTNAFDSDSNQFTEELMEEQISLLANVIELKDVLSTELYDSDNNKISVLDITRGIPTNLEDYYVKINMKNLPTYYASVKSIDIDGKKLNITIDQTKFIMYKENNNHYNKVNNYSFQMAYIDKDGEHTLVKSANELFEKIRNNPSGNYILTEDLDASTVTDNPAIPCTFKGTLDGAGHKIINLSSALFNELNNATVKNLVIENAKITNNSKGVLANNINNNSLVKNVHIKDSSITNNQGTVGSFTGQITKSTIKESSAINVNITANNTVGGIAGTIAGGSIVEDSYVTGSIRGTYNHNTLGARIGGIAGWHSGTKIDHCYTNVNLIAPRELGSGGLVGGPDGHPVIKNSVSLGSGKGYRISGFNKSDNMVNVYEYSKSGSLTSIVEGTINIKSISDIYDKNFYQHTLGFNEEIWNLDLLEHRKLPNLKEDPMPNQVDKYEVKENKTNIPNYGEVRNNRDYHADKEIAYYNLSKLMPFENTNNWVKIANSIPADSLLNKSKIKFILPLGDEDKLIISLGRNETSKIKKIRVIYADDQTEEFSLSYKKTVEDLVAVYKINDSKIEYQFDRYLSNISEELLNTATQLANSLDYSSVIAAITDENESRLYVDFYNESVKENIRDIIYHYLSNEASIPTYSNNKIVKESLSSSLTEEKLIRLLYAYNYYEKWYRIDLDGVKVSDLMFFNGTKLNNTMTVSYMINSVVNTNANNRATNKTVDFYNVNINGKVGKTLPKFLEYLFKTVNGYDDPSDWMVDHFDGLIYEQPAISPISDQIIYRIWPIMTGNSKNMHMLLPILSAPQEDMYLISCPSQYIIGSLNRYSTYLNKDGGERDRMLDLMKNYGTNLGRFYGVSSSFVPNSANRINNIINVQFDTRFYFPASAKADGGTQAAGTTREPVMKWVYEAVGNAWGAANGAGAYANGENVWWIVDTALGYNRAVHVFTHETAHNQDNRYFYSGNGRRPHTGAEAHADGVISQDISIFTSVFNLTKDFALDSDYATNLSYERINSAEKIHSYYKEMYETKYVLEYLAAQAFLRLTPGEQAKIAVQQQHNTGTNYTTSYVRLTEEQIREMNLKTIEDLWDNKLAIRGTGTSPHTWNGSYGHDSFFNYYFYIPNNPDGTPDTTTFKNTGYEMLGYAGYDKGFITYMSGRSANDLVAIRNITGDDAMTWKKYKMSRYENVRNNLSSVNYFEVDAIIDLYESAFKLDAQNSNLNVSQSVTKLYYGIVKRATNDFSTGGIYTKDSQISITSASQFVNLLNENAAGNYRIDADLDFSNIEIPENQNYYIGRKFIGTLDGNGHKFIGVRYALFNSMAYAGIKNLTIEAPTYADNINASIANTGKSFDLYHVKVNLSNLDVPNVVSKSGMYFSSDTNTTTTRSTEISSVEDLLAVGKTSAGLKKSYVLTSDIDLSSVDRKGTPIIPGTFSGSIDGNGHKISNAKDVLFHSITGTIRNLKIENANVTSNNAKGIFSNSLSGASIESISIHNSSIINTTNGVGGLTGSITSSTVNKISLTNVTVKADNTVGGLSGQIGNGTVQNILFTGRVQGTTSRIYNLGSRAAGITGWLTPGATIKNVVTLAEINGYGKTGNGGIIGGPNSGNSNIINSISLSTGTNAYRIAGFNTLNNVSNVYEYALSNSATNINDNNNTKVLVATEDDIKKASFYINSVHLDSEIWNFDDVSSGGVPKLIGVTPSNIQTKATFKLVVPQNKVEVITDDIKKESSEAIIDETKDNSETIIENTTTNNETTTESINNESVVLEKEKKKEEVIKKEDTTKETIENESYSIGN